MCAPCLCMSVHVCMEPSSSFLPCVKTGIVYLRKEHSHIHTYDESMHSAHICDDPQQEIRPYMLCCVTYVIDSCMPNVTRPIHPKVDERWSYKRTHVSVQRETNTTDTVRCHSSFKSKPYFSNHQTIKPYRSTKLIQIHWHSDARTHIRITHHEYKFQWHKSRMHQWNGISTTE